MDVISRQVLDLWNKYKPTIAVDAIEYDRELKELLSTNLAEVGTDLISRQAAIESFRTYFMDGFDEDKWWNSTHVLAAIEGLPPAEPKRGKWIHHPEIGWGETWLCDQCGEKTTSTVMGKPRANFCPMCGADMREVTE